MAFKTFAIWNICDSAGGAAYLLNEVIMFALLG